jgi:hypothetical protein
MICAICGQHRGDVFRCFRCGRIVCQADGNQIQGVWFCLSCVPKGRYPKMRQTILTELIDPC